MPHPAAHRTAPWRRRVKGTEGVLTTSALVVGLLTLIALISLVTETDPELTPLRRIIGLVLVIAASLGFLRLQSNLVRGVSDKHTRAEAYTLVALGVVNIWISFSWTMLGVSTATTLLILRRGVLRYLAAASTIMLGCLELFINPNSDVARVGVPLVSLLVAFVLQTLTQLAQALRELWLSQEELARLRVDDERERISRDLHDLIGRTLVATSLRQQAALHLLDRDTTKARAQLESAHETIAAGQAQLRKLTQGPVSVGLEHEVAATELLCQRLGVEFTHNVEAALPAAVDQWAARLLREAVTNMLKHSSPRHCELLVQLTGHSATISITNDGCPPATSSMHNGTGIGHLRSQLDAIGGTLDSAPIGHGQYRVKAHIAKPTQETP